MRTRKIYGGLVMTAAALLCLAGCKKDEEGEKIMLGTQFEKAVSTQKTYLGENNTVCWSAGDSVKVNDDKYKNISNSGIEVKPADNYYAVYPATAGNLVDANGGTVEIPAVQVFHTENNKQVLNGPMAARLDGKSGILYFRNLYSLLKVTVSADDKAFTVNSITVTATGETPKALAGTQSFKFNGATNTVENLELTNLTNSSTSVKLMGINSTVAANSDADFYLVAHPMTSQNLTVKVVGLQEGKVVLYTYNTASERSLNRNSIGGLAVNLQQLEPVMGGIGVFTINAEGKQVSFSPSNLQYQACDPGTWHFAAHQYDCIRNNSGNNTAEASRATQTGWIDLFGWGTSGWNNGNTFYQPYDCSNAMTEPYTSSKGYGYGPTYGTSYTFDLTGTYENSDWGVYNAIKSYDGSTTYLAKTWRTLTFNEWKYLLETRKETNTNWWVYNAVSIEKPSGYNFFLAGLIIYPDGITAQPDGLSPSVTLTKNSNTAVVITETDFEKLEAMGCVFLPAAGYRSGTSVNGLGDAQGVGYYWSSTCAGSGNASPLHFSISNGNVALNFENTSRKSSGYSVRLVKDIE